MATNSETTKLIKIVVEGGKATASIDDVTVSTKRLNEELSMLSKVGGKKPAGGGTSGATGGATATVMELGRTISDSNYGIRGMANNVSQLASNFLFMTQKVDETTKKAAGFGGALKSVGSALMGPLGILLAIQTAIALLEAWSMKAKEAEVSTDIFKNTVSESAAKMILLDKILSDTTITLEEKSGALDTAKDDMSEFGLNTDDAKISLEGFQEQLKSSIDRLIDVAIAQNILAEFQDTLNKVGETTRNNAEDNLKWYEKAWAMYTNMAVTQASLEAQQVELQERGEANRAEVLEGFNKTLEELMNEFKKRGESGETFYSLVFGNEDDANNSNKIFKQKMLDLSKQILGFQKAEELATEKNEEMKLLIKQKYERAELKLKLTSFKEKEEMRYKDFMASNASDEQKLLAKERFENSKLEADKEYQKALTELTVKQETIRDEFRFNQLKEYTDKVEKAVLDGEIQDLSISAAMDSGVDALNRQQTLLQAEFNNKVYWLNQEIEERKIAGEAYEDIEKQKRNVTNKYENEKLVLVKKTEQAKRSIVALGFQAISKIAEDGSSVNKAASAAAALMSTYEAANAALGAKPYGPWNKAEAAIVIAMGLANVQKIFDTPTPGGRGGRGGQGGAGRTFDFNLVGSTGANQLAEAVGGQFQEPIQAYVVSNEMTSQQELDLQIQTGASLGD